MSNKYLVEIKKEMDNSIDLIYRRINISNTDCYVIFLKSMTDKQMLAESVILPLQRIKNITPNKVKNTLFASEIKELDNVQDIVNDIVTNNVIILVGNNKKAISVNLEKFPQRMPSEPPTSSVIQGPRVGFTEELTTNITLMRRRFPTSKFKMQNVVVGKYTKTKIAICYLSGVANMKVVNTIKKRIESISIDGIIDSYYLISYLQERKKSLFKQVGSSEKPDVVCAKLLEGRVAIICDGSPIVLTLPFLYIEDIQNSYDYYTNLHYSTLIRVIRIIGIFVATAAPGFFLALRLYHYKIVPLKYIVTISNSTENLPFTPFVEMLFILILFQILYEVSLRLPHYLGLATSIVGALILGDTGVKAGLISPPGVIIVALSLISIYTVPEQSPQFTVLRFLFILAGGCLGLLGIAGLTIYVINYCNTLNAYGAPYLAPYTPRVNSDLKDGIIRKSITEMNSRPKSFKVENEERSKR